MNETKPPRIALSPGYGHVDRVRLWQEKTAVKNPPYDPADPDNKSDMQFLIISKEGTGTNALWQRQMEEYTNPSRFVNNEPVYQVVIMGDDPKQAELAKEFHISSSEILLATDRAKFLELRELRRQNSSRSASDMSTRSAAQAQQILKSGEDSSNVSGQLSSFSKRGKPITVEPNDL